MKSEISERFFHYRYHQLLFQKTVEDITSQNFLLMAMSFLLSY